MGGFPWTDVFGSGYKWVQKTTQSGFPTTWQGRGVLSSSHSGQVVTIDKMLQKAAALNLEGEVSLNLPKSPEGVYTVDNETTHFSEMKSIHFDQYTGEVIAQNTWDDIGIMMKSRLWLMAFHQRKVWNVEFCTHIGDSSSTHSVKHCCYLFYLYRPSPSGIKISGSEKGGIAIFPTIIISILGILLPLFGGKFDHYINRFQTIHKAQEISCSV